MKFLIGLICQCADEFVSMSAQVIAQAHNYGPVCVKYDANDEERSVAEKFTRGILCLSK